MRKNHWNMNSSSPRCNTVKCAKRCVARRCYRALRGGGSLNRNQRAAARGLSLAAYLLFSEGRERDEGSITRNLPSCKDIHESSLGKDRDRDRARYAVRKQLARDVEALSGAGIGVEVTGETDGRRYRLSRERFLAGRTRPERGGEVCPRRGTPDLLEGLSILGCPSAGRCEPSEADYRAGPR